MIWWSLIIPLIALGVLFFFFKHKLHIKEIIALVLVPTCVITFFYFATKNSHMSDTQQLSELIVKARYYESWETWVEQQCSRQVYDGEDCTTGSDGKQTCVTKYRTEYYDCSYCDYNSEYYVAVTISNKEITISRAQYYALLKKWKTKGSFVELDRSINFSGSCGKDGDMYEGNWNLDLFTAESHTWQESYNNRTQASLSAFNYPKITPIEAKKLGLYEYPIKYYNGYTEPNILGFENIYQSRQLKDSIFTLYQYLNGFIGPQYKAHVYILLFKDQDINIAFKQEAYWANGNQNEIVICIGHGALGKIQWVKPFSWCENKRVLVDLREDISELKYFDYFKAYPIIVKAIKDNYHYRNLDKDFNYLNIELTEGELIAAYVTILIITLLLSFYFITNDYE